MSKQKIDTRIDTVFDILQDPTFFFKQEADGSIIFSKINESGLEIFGNRVTSYLGNSLESLSGILPGIEINIKKAMKTGKNLKGEYSWRVETQSKGRSLFDAFRVAPKELSFLVDFVKSITNPDSVLMIAKDVSPLKEAQNELRESAEFNFGLLSEYSPLGMVYIATDGTIKYMHPASTRQMGFLDNQVTNLVGKRIFDLPNMYNNPEIIEGIEKLLEGEPLVGLEITNPMKDENILFTAFGTPRFDPDGSVTGAVFMYIEKPQSLADE